MAVEPTSTTTTIIVIRHGEKTGSPGDRGLSAEGRQRALALAAGLPQMFGRIDAIFAAAPSKKSNRPVETVQPLAAALNLDIEARWGTWDYEDLAAQVLGEPKFSGRTILICWRHDALQALARALGADEAGPWPETLYDRMWVIRPGDAANPLTEARSF